ncbi:MAG TPA: hypothetical protein VHS99_25930 [Chloroflexota bacterium]|nr:hypothetical protein [Chloroflexota bacterium]
MIPRRQGRRPPALARTAAVGAVCLGLALLVWLAITAMARAGEGSVRGFVTSVEARDIGHAETLTLRAEDGQEWRFRVDAAVDMTPGHLREHMTFGQPVTVFYRPDGDGLLAVRVTD